MRDRAELRNLGLQGEHATEAEAAAEYKRRRRRAPAVVIRNATQVIVVEHVEGDLYLGRPGDWGKVEAPGA